MKGDGQYSKTGNRGFGGGDPRIRWFFGGEAVGRRSDPYGFLGLDLGLDLGWDLGWDGVGRPWPYGFFGLVS